MSNFKKGDKVFVVEHLNYDMEDLVDLRALKLLQGTITGYWDDCYEITIKDHNNMILEVSEQYLLPAQPDVEGALETLQAYIKNVLGDYKVSDKTRCD